MRQFAGESVQVIDDNRMDQAVMDHIRELFELGTVYAGPSVVIAQDMRLWDGMAFLPSQHQTGVYLGGKRVAFVGLIRSRDTGIDGRRQQDRELRGRVLP